MDTEKKSLISKASATVSAVLLLLGGIWAVDDHYASAADVEKLQRNVETRITQYQQQQLENQLFILDLKKQQQNGKLDPLDSAMSERYRRQLQQLNTTVPSDK